MWLPVGSGGELAGVAGGELLRSIYSISHIRGRVNEINDLGGVWTVEIVPQSRRGVNFWQKKAPPERGQSVLLV